jgi:hypothetical protein
LVYECTITPLISAIVRLFERYRDCCNFAEEDDEQPEIRKDKLKVLMTNTNRKHVHLFRRQLTNMGFHFEDVDCSLLSKPVAHNQKAWIIYK